MVDPDDLVAKAWLLENAGRPDSALTILGQVLTSHPDHAGALVAAAMMHVHLGETSRAVELANRAMGKTTAVNDQLQVLTVLYRAGRSVAAADLAERLIPSVGGQPDYLAFLAAVLQKRNPIQALHLARQADQGVPSPDGLLLVAHVYAAEDRSGVNRKQLWNRAELIAKQALAADPYDESAHEILTQVSANRGHYAKALARASLAAQTSPQDMGTMPVIELFGYLVGGSVGWVGFSIVGTWYGIRRGIPAVPLVITATLATLLVIGLVVVARRLGQRQFRRITGQALRYDPGILVMVVGLAPFPFTVSTFGVTWPHQPWWLGLIALSLFAVSIPTPSFFRRANQALDSPLVLMGYLVRRVTATAMAFTFAVGLMTADKDYCAPLALTVLAGVGALLGGIGWPLLFYRRRLDWQRMRQALAGQRLWQALLVAALVLLAGALVSPLLPSLFGRMWWLIALAVTLVASHALGRLTAAAQE